MSSEYDDADSWAEGYDETTGRKFYCNVKNNEAVWEMPEAVRRKKQAAGEQEWWELWDTSRNAAYYYDAFTGNTAWTLPPGSRPIKMHKETSIGTPENNTPATSTNHNSVAIPATSSTGAVTAQQNGHNNTETAVAVPPRPVSPRVLNANSSKSQISPRRVTSPAPLAQQAHEAPSALTSNSNGHNLRHTPAIPNGSVSASAPALTTNGTNAVPTPPRPAINKGRSAEQLRARSSVGPGLNGASDARALRTNNNAPAGAQPQDAAPIVAASTSSEQPIVVPPPPNRSTRLRPSVSARNPYPENQRITQSSEPPVSPLAAGLRGRPLVTSSPEMSRPPRDAFTAQPSVPPSAPPSAPSRTPSQTPPATPPARNFNSHVRNASQGATPVPRPPRPVSHFASSPYKEEPPVAPMQRPSAGSSVGPRAQRQSLNNIPPLKLTNSNENVAVGMSQSSREHVPGQPQPIPLRPSPRSMPMSAKEYNQKEKERAKAEKVAEKAKEKEKEKEKKKGSGRKHNKGVTKGEAHPVLKREIIVDINKFQLESYAAKYFQARKKGLFRKHIPIKELLMFEGEPITSPVLKLQDQLNPIAMNIFKKILGYQGVQCAGVESGPDPMVLAREIVCEGIREGQIRDEIYCQLCKQTCYTPNEEFLYKAWELMLFCCLVFPPTQNFEEWLRKYISEHVRSVNKEAAYATFCLRKLDIACRSGPRGRIPSLYELKTIKDAPFITSPFSVTLEEIMNNQKAAQPTLAVPFILITLCTAVLEMGGCDIEGIFRIPSDSEPLYDLKADIEVGDYSLKHVTNANTPASLLKLWLRELKEPLIPDDYYDVCLAAAEDAQESVATVKRMPIINQRVLSYLVRFLQIVASPENQKKTKMSVNNLAMIFAPNFLRCKSDSAEVIFNNTRQEQMYMKNLLVFLETSDTLS